jgi:hypothetical protein
MVLESNGYDVRGVVSWCQNDGHGVCGGVTEMTGLSMHLLREGIKGKEVGGCGGRRCDKIRKQPNSSVTIV